jgi:adenylosuccinate synthase
MPNVVVVGAQWGDEGKGKVVDLLADRFDVVARYQGGPNAGHTVTVGAKRHALHHIPSGAFRAGVRLVIGNGTVIDLAGLNREVAELREARVEVDGRLFLSERAHVILPEMARLDALHEDGASDGERIGTTKRGIGPAYEAKAARAGIRFADLLEQEHLEDRVRALIEGPFGRRLRDAGEKPHDAGTIARALHEGAQPLFPFVTDTCLLLNQWMDEGKSVLFEGAQGALLDLDSGSYPYVTSSSTIAGGCCTGLGVAPTRIDGIVGVFKAYATRVGSGPLPTELLDGSEGAGELLRKRGREYGTTTGRPRRCGWFDGVAAAHSYRVNRFDSVSIMLLDVLDVFEEIRVCVAYRLDGQDVQTMPASAFTAARVEPVYETLPGWRTDLTGVRAWSELPREAVRFLDRLAELIGAEVGLVSVGPERTQSILKPGSWLARTLREP